MLVGEILDLARRAGVGPRATVLDLCCGIAGPGRLLTAELGCDYLGVDSSTSAVEIARELAGSLSCRFEVGHVPPLPAGAFDVVLLLETMLAFEDKAPLLDAVSAALAPGGRFAFTVEEGAALTPTEQEAMPDSDTVWLVGLDELVALLGDAGLRVRWQRECSPAHRDVAGALLSAFEDDADAIRALIGRRAHDDLVAAHRLWWEWLGSGRVRKFAVVAERATHPPTRRAAGSA